MYTAAFPIFRVSSVFFMKGAYFMGFLDSLKKIFDAAENAGKKINDSVLSSAAPKNRKLLSPVLL